MIAGIILLAAFILWTILICCVDVQPLGQNGTNIGFASFNVRFHELTGEHMMLYKLTDLIELAAIAVCVCFAGLGLVQLIKRKSLRKVDADIVLLGIYYIVVILAYLFFEKVPINYRPVLIDGALEASYPSSTTLLVLSVMPTLKFQIDRRAGNEIVKRITTAFVIIFSAFIVIGRIFSGVHWATDIVGAVLLSFGLYLIYRAAVFLTDEKRS